MSLKKVIVVSAVVVGCALFVGANFRPSYVVGSTEKVVLAASVSQESAVKRPTLEAVLYHTWEESTDSTFHPEVTYEEVVSNHMLAGADVYVIDSYEYDKSNNLVIYYHTDYMKARLIAYADRDYKYMEANYFVEDNNDYDGDTLYFRRKI